MHDPNPAQADGALRLRDAGVRVDIGLFEREAPSSTSASFPG